MFRDIFKIASMSRWYHHENRVQRSKRRKEECKSQLSYADLKTLRKSCFWIFLVSTFLNWGFIGAVCAIDWIGLWIVATLY
ncbi:hypothetical protein EFS30_09495 [Levilactobacillus parabrevis]|nr:hypothetical protein [Levilactobacillus parabrevis]MCT4490832.1 hypothetical protein [Levilactobacillus parabrevis]OOV21065.1 hypothetical protein LG101_13830 [Levilactobacillus brevis]OOV21159.1 hypothetical protein LG101_13470 [Levilactobacillus brevis]